MGLFPAAVHRRPAPAGRTSCRSCRSTCRSKRAGRTYKGLVRSTREKTPSFHVNPDKGFFHCFGCSVGGDVFKFLELHEKVGFQDAVRMLAQKFGIALPGADRGRRRRRAARLGAARGAAEGRTRSRRRTSASSSPAPAGARARQQLDRPRRHARRRSSSSASASRRQSRDGLKARLLDAGLRAGRAAAERPGRAARQRRGRRSVPQPADDSDLPRHRVGHRVRRPADGRRTRAAEVPELAGNADLLEGPDALRPEPDEGGRSGKSASPSWSRAISISRRCSSRRRPRSSPRAARR